MQSIESLLKIMAALRSPDGGCPWDLAQDFKSVIPHTIEEAYEVADAIDNEQWEELRLELGDLLFQVVFYAQLADEQGYFSFSDIVVGICEKMRRRHPHVFSDQQPESPAGHSEAWERHKARESDQNPSSSILEQVPKALPAHTRAYKLQRGAARVGFDWPTTEGVFDKIDEEVGELKRALSEGADGGEIESEIGDLLFTCINLARHLEVNPEQALRAANRKFTARFTTIEANLVEAGKDIESTSLEELNSLWELAKLKSSG